MVVSPNDVDALVTALQEAVDAKIPVVTFDRRVNKVPGILAHVGADNVKGGEAQGQLIEKLFPNGATVMNLQGQSGEAQLSIATKVSTMSSIRPRINTKSSSKIPPASNAIRVCP